MEEKKREFKAVAMRFTQEAFDGMDKTGMSIYNVSDFKNHEYLTNNFVLTEGLITNVNGEIDLPKIEFWDEDIFRICCGLEPKSKKDNSEFLLASFGSKKVEIGKLNYLEALDLLNGHAEIQPTDKMKKMIDEESPLVPPSLVLKRTSRFSDKKELSLNIVLKDQFSGKIETLKERIEQLKKTSQFHSVAFIQPLFINLMNYTYEQKKIRDEMNECGKKPIVFSRVISEKDFSTPFFKDLLSQLREKEMSDEMKHATNLEAGIRNNINKPIECDNEPKTFKAKDIEYLSLSGNGKWDSLDSIITSTTLRFKPKPTPEESLSTEIESLSEKAKKLGLKATVLFEKS